MFVLAVETQAAVFKCYVGGRERNCRAKLIAMPSMIGVDIQNCGFI